MRSFGLRGLAATVFDFITGKSVVDRPASKPKGKIVPAPGFNTEVDKGGPRVLRFIHPPVQPNCRAEHAYRVRRGSVAFVYPGTR